MINQNACFEITGIFEFRRGTGSWSTNGRDFSVLSCRISGDTVFTQNKKKINVKTGEVIYIPEGTEYSQETAGEHVIAIHIKEYSAIDKKIGILGMDSSEAAEFFLEILKVWKKMKRAYKMQCTSMLYGFLAQALRYTQKNTSKIERSVEYMQSHYYIPTLTVSDIAKKSYISEIYFRQLWANEYGCTPLKYLNEIRIKNAKKLLKSGYYKINEVAEMTGFCDSKYFSTKFKKITGQTPTEYSAKNEVLPG